jgi:hypothetical protein
MPTGLIYNPGAVDGLNAYAGNVTIMAINGDTVALPMGTLVEVVTPFAGPSSPPYSGTPAPFLVKRSATTADFMLLGVVTGVVPTTGPATQTAASSNSVPVGGVAEITIDGLCQIIMDDTGGGVTVKDNIAQSTITAGEGATSTSTATAGKTIGQVLQTVTIASGNALVWAYIHKT